MADASLDNWVASVRTLEEAKNFVLTVGACGILHDSKGGYSLWDAIDAPDKLPGESGWGEKMGYVWSWKNELPSTYPHEIFYGKRKQGAMLCSMEALKAFYSETYKPLESLSETAQSLYRIIEQAPVNNKELKQLAFMVGKDQKSAYDKALLELQLTFQIVRVNSTEVDGDTWTPFTTQYPDFKP